MRYRRVILLDPQFQIDAIPLGEKQMPALDAVNFVCADLPTGGNPAQKRFVRSLGKKIDQRKIGVELLDPVESRRNISRCGNHHVLFVIGRGDSNRLPVVDQIVASADARTQ